MACEEAAGLRADQLDDLVFRPDIELALLVFRVGVERRRESASGVVISRLSHSTVSAARVRNSAVPLR